MQLYNAKVRLANNLLNEVSKARVTAAEIICLRDVHGDGAVVDVKPVKMDKRAHDAERDRLVQRFGKARIERLFGNAFQKLPTKLGRDGGATADDQEPKSKGTKSKPAPEPEDEPEANPADNDSAEPAFAPSLAE